MKPRGRLAGPMLVAAALAGCSTSGLSFRVDERVDIRAPEDRTTVEVPLLLDWEATGIDRFAVFVDSSPQPPGRPVEWVARNDDDCHATPGCPDPQYLADRGIFVTDVSEVRVERVEIDPSEGRCQMHEATVVALDDRLNRSGEGAWSVEFETCRGTSS